MPLSPSASEINSAIRSARSSCGSRAAIAALDGLRVEQVADDFRERPVRDALAVGQAAAAQHRRLGADLPRELLHEARLADPGFAEHGQEMTLPGLDDALEGVEQRAVLLLAIDERRVEAARSTRRVRPHLGDRVALESLASLHAAIRDPLRDDRIAHEAVRHLADEDLVRRRRLFEALCRL